MSDIAILQKQNDGIIASLKAKNIAFDYEVIDETLPHQEKLEKYKTLNAYLKDLSAKNRPPPQPKAEPKKEQETKPKLK